MSHHALLEYIRRAKDCGADDAQITSRLHSAGWYRVDIEDALGLYHRLTRGQEEKSAVCEVSPETPKPNIAERIIPRTYDPHIVAVAALSFALGFVLYVLIR